jgi:hypothetical protein
MTAKTIDCVECGESVSYGRLSCPACGALLASVAGSRPRPARAPRKAKAEAVRGPDVAEASVTTADPAPRAAAVLTLAAAPGSDIPPNQIELTLDGPPPDAVEPAAADEAGAAETWDEPEVQAEAEPEATDQAADPAEPVELQPAAFSLSPEPGAALPAPVRTPFDGPEPILVARPYGHRVEVMAGSASGRSPSAYRAPALVLSTATAAGSSWPSTSTTAAGSSIVARDAADPEPATATGERAQATRIAEIGTWFVIVGAAMSVLGFLLPWSRVVIGSRGLGGYLDNWGLASPTHVIVLLATLAILGLGILRTTVPVWLWAGVFALALGGVLLGLTWPYQIGPLGADVGVIVVGLGGLALVIGGVVTSWATRHVEVEPAV